MKKKNTPVGQSQSQSSISGSRVPQGWAFPFSLGEFSRPLHQQHRSMEQARVLALVKRRISRQWPLTEVVGQWVWVHTPERITEVEESMLFELGFHYSPRRLAWQHPCGAFSSSSRQPFLKYFPAEQEGRPLEFIPHF